MRTARLVRLGLGLLAGLGALAGVPTAAHAQPEAEVALKVEGSPVPLRVIIRRPTPIRLEPATDAAARREAKPMEFFFVLPGPAGVKEINKAENGFWYRVASKESVAKGGHLGYVWSEDCTEWSHREALGFVPRGLSGGSRGRVRFYESPADWQRGFEYPQDQKDPAAIALEPMRLGNMGFVLPVLESRENQVLKVDGSVHQLYRVAFIAAPKAPAPPKQTEGAPPEGSDPGVRPADPGAEVAPIRDFQVDIVFCVDASESMQPSVDAVRDAMRELSKSLREQHPDLKDRCRFGLVVFRGWKEAEVVLSLADGADHEQFVAAISKVVAERGTGHGEDVMGGMKLAVNEMDWSDVGFKEVILVGDEVAYHDDNHPEWNSAGLSIQDLVRQAQPLEETISQFDGLRLCRTITAVEIMAEHNGPAAAKIRTSQFQALTQGPFPGDHLQFKPGDVSRMRQALLERLTERVQGAKRIFAAATAEQPAPTAKDGTPPSDQRSPAPAATLTDKGPEFWRGVPAPFRELVELLPAGMDEDLESMQQGWISRFDLLGAETVSERFLINRYRLIRLQQIIETVGTELDQPEINAPMLVAMLQQRLAAMSIDHDLHPSTPLAQVFEVVSGLPIRTPLMVLTPEQIANQTPADRARLVDKLKKMGRNLQQQVNAPELWFKLDPADQDRDMLAFVSISDFM